jgi:hypothetical protein
MRWIEFYLTCDVSAQYRRLDAAQRSIGKIVAVKGSKTIGNTLANGRRIRRRNALKPRPVPPYRCMPGEFSAPAAGVLKCAGEYYWRIT